MKDYEGRELEIDDIVMFTRPYGESKQLSKGKIIKVAPGYVKIMEIYRDGTEATYPITKQSSTHLYKIC